MKALSCIHVTISPKEDFKVLDVSNVVESYAANESPACGLRTNSEMPALPSANLSGNGQVLFPGIVTPNSSYFLHSAPKATNGEIKEDVVQMLDKEDTPERLSQSDRRRWPLSDATTQITTESPEKTSFSAEIFIDGTPKEVSASLGKPERTPERRSPSSTPLSSLCRATDQPLLIPYKPPGSPELFYVPRMDGGFRTSPVSTIESSHPGSNDAMSPKFPAEILGSATEKLSDPSIPRHKDGIYSKDQGPRIAWDQSREQRKTPAGFHDDLELSKNLHHKAKQTHMPGIEPEKEFGGYSKASYGTLQPRGPQPAAVPRERSDNRREKYHLRSSFEDSEFYPLQAEVDSTAEQQSDIMLPLRYKSLESASE
ncbi:centrosome-associated protein ALMS1-like [Mixophyes fleayi]|uniref:centrosome-associated protein ALMS1-like n=1 Tax=Mixophyes fleayi TaxID=3061075 RepID=UPI003F4DF104